MSLPDLAAVLWRQRDLLERLTYRLECEQLLLAAGRNRWLSVATSEVERVLEELRIVEMQRAVIADQVARSVGLDPGATLEELASAAQPPWTGVLIEHRQALISLSAELSAVAETNRHLIEAGARGVDAALRDLSEGGDLRSAIGYDARGRTKLVATAARAGVDRAL